MKLAFLKKHIGYLDGYDRNFVDSHKRQPLLLLDDLVVLRFQLHPGSSTIVVQEFPEDFDIYDLNEFIEKTDF
jgi:hypothetical protein